jgi:hypothetical protein
MLKSMMYCYRSPPPYIFRLCDDSNRGDNLSAANPGKEFVPTKNCTCLAHMYFLFIKYMNIRKVNIFYKLYNSTNIIVM